MTDEQQAADDAVFTVEVTCSNCGAVETWPFSAETFVEQRQDGVRVNACDALGCTADCERCGYIECPVCSLSDHLGVTERRPIEQADEHENTTDTD